MWHGRSMAAQMDLKEMSVDEALRSFQAHFRLPVCAHFVSFVLSFCIFSAQPSLRGPPPPQYLPAPTPISPPFLTHMLAFQLPSFPSFPSFVLIPFHSCLIHYYLSIRRVRCHTIPHFLHSPSSLLFSFHTCITFYDLSLELLISHYAILFAFFFLYLPLCLRLLCCHSRFHKANRICTAFRLILVLKDNKIPLKDSNYIDTISFVSSTLLISFKNFILS